MLEILPIEWLNRVVPEWSNNETTEPGWSIKLGCNQAEVIERATCQVICAAQTAVDKNGAPRLLDDMRLQIALAFDNLKIVIKDAGIETQMAACCAL